MSNNSLEKLAIVIGALVYGGGCTPLPDTLPPSDDIEGLPGVVTDEAENTVLLELQIEVPDRGIGLEGNGSALALWNLGPALRVGTELSAIRDADGDPDAFTAALLQSARIIRLSDGLSVPYEGYVETSYGAHDIHGQSFRDRYGPPRLSSGLSLVPTGQLADGWYAVVVTVPPLPAGVTGPASLWFSNLSGDGWIASRFRVGSGTVLVSVNVTCGDAAAWGLASQEAPAFCNYRAIYSGASVGHQPPTVRYDGEEIVCRTDHVLNGRPVVGAVCPVPSEGVLVEIESSLVVEGSASTSFIYSASLEPDEHARRLVPSQFTPYVFPVDEDFGIEHFPSP